MTPFRSFDHVQLAMPAGEEARARAFYVGVLEMSEIPKPEDLRANGGAWFASGDVAVHLGVDPHFVPARKAHPAFRCADLAALRARFHAASVAVTEAGKFEDGLAHVYVSDPFGNRIELIG
jgi:catechol 2,3-dioxygenase-like lactoylglutathione lyase family enzyme